MKKPVIKGTRGKWTAEYKGRTLPVIHNFRLTRSQKPDGTMSVMYSDDIEHVRYGKAATDWAASFDNPDQWVIVQRGVKNAAGNETRDRNGYVGVFRFANLDLQDGVGCRLELLQRIG